MLTITVDGTWPTFKIDDEDLTELFRLSSMYMLASVQENIIEGGRPPWQHTKRGAIPNFYGGKLYNAIKPSYGANFAEVSISTSEVPYAAIHQFGGEIFQVVTNKQRGFFWFMYSETGDEMWKGMALSKSLLIEMPARPYMMFQEEDVEVLAQMFGDNLIKIINAKGENINAVN